MGLPFDSRSVQSALLLVLLLSAGCCSAFGDIDLNSPNITFELFDRNFTVPWPVPLGKLIFVWLYGSALATGRRKRRGLLDVMAEGEDVRADLSEALEAYIAAKGNNALHGEEEEESETAGEEEEVSWVPSEVPDVTDSVDCEWKLACEVAKQEGADLEMLKRYVGARFVSLVLEERSRARAVEEAEAEGIPVDQDMVLKTCGDRFPCDVERKLLLGLGQAIAASKDKEEEEEEEALYGSNL